MPLASRRLVTITANLEGVGPIGQDETGRIEGAIAGAKPFTDATVRLRYTASEEQHRRVDTAAVKRAIMAAGAHRVYSVEPTILRADRARAKVDESMEPAVALEAWCEANGVAEAQREGLQGLLERYSA